MTSIVLIDDHPLFRDGVRAALDGSPFQIVAEASNGVDGVALAIQHQPEIAVVDISMPGLDGLATARELRRKLPQIKILILTLHSSPLYLRESFSAGAHGFAVKDQQAAELVEALRTVQRGERYVPPTMRAVQVEGTAEGGPLASLSPREREIFGLIVAGHSNDSIAHHLSISIKTVETHRAHINSKLDVHSTADLVRFAAKYGFLAPG